MRLQSRRVWSGISIGFVTAAHALALAQEATPGNKRPGKGDEVVARGCLSGPTLQSVETVGADDTGRVSVPLTYQLKGDKKLLARMREEHDGSVLSVTGVLRSTLPHEGGVGGKTMGKTKVTFGIGTPSGQRDAPENQPALPVLEVKSYEGDGSRCTR